MSAGDCVSIVIPTFNAGPLFERTLQAIRAQRTSRRIEILAVDSGSSDGTIDRLRQADAAIVSIDRRDFNHGETRNAGLVHASGPLAVLLVQDAVPASDDWLEALIAPLSDERVAGSFGRQQPWPDASRLTAHYLGRWVAAQPQPRLVGPLTRREYDAMSPAERHATCAFDNVCSCVRVSAWRKHRFRRTPIAEDLQWAAEVLLDGYRIAYAPAALVWHSHERSVGYELKRTYLVHRQLQQIFGLSTVPTASSLVRSVAATLPAHVRLAAHEPRRKRARALVRGAGLAVVLPLGQYLGARASREGRELLRIRGV
jgi:rhamnosyltransferase